MPQYHGTCHCGAVAFDFTAIEITDALRCNCSICKRKGAALTSFTVPPGNLAIRASEDRLSTYRFGTKTAKHYFCNRCGIFTFVQTRLTPGEYRVNLGCVDEVDSFSLPTVLFDGTSI